MMKRTIYFAVAILVVLVASAAVALAGGDGRCDESVETTAARLAAHGWLGIETDKDGSGRYTVAEVAPGSPAEKAGFRAGDVLVAFNGIELAEANKPALKAAKKQLRVGSEVKYTVARQGKRIDLGATLTEVPRDVLARWVGEHVLDQHATGVAVAQAD